MCLNPFFTITLEHWNTLSKFEIWLRQISRKVLKRFSDKVIELIMELVPAALPLAERDDPTFKRNYPALAIINLKILKDSGQWFKVRPMILFCFLRKPTK